MDNLRSQQLGFAFLLGLCGPWALGWLVVHAFPIHFHFTQFFVLMLRDSYGWNLSEIQPYSRALYALISALTYSIVFGLPLGLFLKQHWFFSWLAFVLGYLVAAFGLAIDSGEFGLGVLLLEFSLFEFWLMLLAALAFAYLGQFLRRVRGLRPARA